MSEETTAEAPVKAKKPTTVYTKVKMDDGREVEFPGKQKLKKSVIFDGDVAVGVQFDYLSGAVRKLHLNELPTDTREYSACHGLLQKIGDQTSGETEVDDIVMQQDELIARLKQPGGWFVEREAGDSMAGASIVIKALVETTGKSVEFIKDFLNKKLEAAKAKGEKLTRQALYDGFRRQGTKTGEVIRRLEEERAAKASGGVNADDLMAEITAG